MKDEIDGTPNRPTGLTAGAASVRARAEHVKCHRIRILLLVAVVGSLSARTAAHANTLTVLNTLDKGSGSLRNTIAGAKDGDVIVFDSSLEGQTITLISDELSINKDLAIQGPGADMLTISGNSTNRIFEIVEGATVSIAGLTMSHGRALARGGAGGDRGGGGGGAILNAGNLTVTDAVFFDNQARTHGGAIANVPYGVLTVLRTAFTNNQAIAKDPFSIGEGGAIFNSNHPSTATIADCVFAQNQAMGGDGGVLGTDQLLLGECNGGAIHNGSRSTLIVKNCTFAGNRAIAGSGGSGGTRDGGFVGVAIGGAIANDENIEGAQLVVDGCSFVYNQAIAGTNCTGSSTGFGYIGTSRGGAIYQGGVGTVTRSVFIGNQAVGGSGNSGGSGDVLVGVGIGGAIDNNFFGISAVSLIVDSCGFTNNQAVGGAGNAGPMFVGSGIGAGIENSQSSVAAVTSCTLTGNAAIGGAGNTGASGGDALGGGVANFLGSSLTLNNSTLVGNTSVGGSGGAGGNGGNGLGGGVFNGGLSQFPGFSGISPTLALVASTITMNTANGGIAGLGASPGFGIGGGVYSGADGACLDPITSIFANTASTRDNDLFGILSLCP
jgi:predicted outer membrane repeat protein